MNIWDVLILLAIACVVVLALRHLKNGKTKGCSCGCSECRFDCVNREKSPENRETE